MRSINLPHALVSPRERNLASLSTNEKVFEDGYNSNKNTGLWHEMVEFECDQKFEEFDLRVTENIPDLSAVNKNDDKINNKSVFIPLEEEAIQKMKVAD